VKCLHHIYRLDIYALPASGQLGGKQQHSFVESLKARSLYSHPVRIVAPHASIVLYESIPTSLLYVHAMHTPRLPKGKPDEIARQSRVCQSKQDVY
jgi:hypothetical protein